MPRRSRCPSSATYFPELAGIAVTPTAQITMRGPLNRLRLTVAARDAAGAINATGEAGFVDGVQFKGTVELARTNLAPWVGRQALASRITGRADVDLKWPSGSGVKGLDVTYVAKAPEVAIANYRADAVDVRGTYRGGVVEADGSAIAYGARARGHVRWSPAEFSSRGHVEGVDLRRLPTHLDDSCVRDSHRRRLHGVR